MKHRIFSIICCFLLCFTFRGSALAQNGLSSRQGQAIVWAMDNEYLDSGSDKTCFLDERLSGSTFIHAICAKWFPELLPLEYIDQITWLCNEGYVSGPEYARLVKQEVNRIMVWRITLILSGNSPVPAFCFPEIGPQAECEGVYADARATAIRMGLANDADYGIAMLPQSEFFAYFKDLCEGRFVPLPDILSGLPGSDLIDFPSSVHTQVNYRAWNGYFKGYGNLPQEWLSRFREDGWRFVFHPVYDGPFPEFRDVQGGLTVYTSKQIYLNRSDERGLYHEFGHFVMKEAGLTERIEPVFHAEASSMQKILGDYSQSNAKEYFAECFSFWLQDAGNQAILQEHTPGMYEILASVFD